MRNAGFALTITLIGGIAIAHALAELTLATRPRLERWQTKRAYGTGLYPKGWRR